MKIFIAITFLLSGVSLHASEIQSQNQDSKKLGTLIRCEKEVNQYGKIVSIRYRELSLEGSSKRDDEVPSFIKSVSGEVTGEYGVYVNGINTTEAQFSALKKKCTDLHAWTDDI